MQKIHHYEKRLQKYITMKKGCKNISLWKKTAKKYHYEKRLQTILHYEKKLQKIYYEKSLKKIHHYEKRLQKIYHYEKRLQKMLHYETKAAKNISLFKKRLQKLYHYEIRLQKLYHYEIRLQKIYHYETKAAKSIPLWKKAALAFAEFSNYKEVWQRFRRSGISQWSVISKREKGISPRVISAFSQVFVQIGVIIVIVRELWLFWILQFHCSVICFYIPGVNSTFLI